jgi:hypothetical protein
MNVVLLNGGINWNFLSRSIGPYKVAHWIRKHGYSCQVIDWINDFTDDQLNFLLEKFISNETLVLGVSTTFLSSNLHTWKNGDEARMPENIIIAIRRIKIKYPKLKIVLGGYMSDKVSGWHIADASVMSYTEATEDIFLEYLDHLKLGTPLPYAEVKIPDFSNNVTVVAKPRPVFNKARNPVYNIETDDFRFVKEDCIMPGEPLPLDVSRGCIFACRFCQYPHLGKKKLDYIRGMTYIEEEMLYNYENFGTDKYYILDDTFNDTEFKMQEFNNMTQRLPFKIKYSAYIRADLVHRFPDTAYMLKESGIFGAFHGLESLHPSASNLVGKAWSGKHARDFIPKLYHNIWKREVPMTTSFIVGLPGETPEHLYSTADWHLQNYLHSTIFYRLGLWNPKDKGNTIWTVTSEFDRNSEKYGFRFVTSPITGKSTWENDQWTFHTATDAVYKLNTAVSKKIRSSSWTSITALWTGFSLEDILRKPTYDFDPDIIPNFRKKTLQEYYEKLIAI